MATGALDCRHYDAGECRSCTWLPRPYDEQLAAKEASARALVGGVTVEWLPAYRSAVSGFRTKAKLVVGGSVEAPTLGILSPDGLGVDLRDCALYAAPMVAALPTLAGFVTRAGLTPYDVPSRRGELKHVLVTSSEAGELMVRFVVRSTEPEARIRKHLAWLIGAVPSIRVVTLNVQPAHAAILEGERELVLTEASSLPMPVNDVTLHLGPRSFFQTNTEVAAALYRQAREWVSVLPVRSVLDLYCGVGGFALHLAAAGREVLGVEISDDAVAAAERARDDAGLSAEPVTFEAGDATARLVDRRDLVVVNPPRRGIGPELCARIEEAGSPYLLYSSCNPETLARDLAALPSYAPVTARLFDMFPHTAHAEVLVLLQRAA